MPLWAINIMPWTETRIKYFTQHLATTSIKTMTLTITHWLKQFAIHSAWDVGSVSKDALRCFFSKCKFKGGQGRPIISETKISASVLIMECQDFSRRFSTQDLLQQQCFQVVHIDVFNSSQLNFELSFPCSSLESLYLTFVVSSSFVGFSCRSWFTICPH